MSQQMQLFLSLKKGAADREGIHAPRKELDSLGEMIPLAEVKCYKK